MTLRELWKLRGVTSTEVATAAHVSPPTIYKLNRREGEEGEVKLKTVRLVCQFLGISLNEFEELEPCPEGHMYKGRGRKKSHEHL